MKTYLPLLSALATAICWGSVLAQDIVHDGEYRFLQAQHGDRWAEQNDTIDARLAEIRRANGGKPPNILYVLIDDVSFGTMGNRALNYVTGIQTPSINEFAELPSGPAWRR
jgi:arylsulfatase